MDVEHLQVVLSASGLTQLQANLAAADRAYDSTKHHAEQLAYVSKTTNDALNKIKIVAAQAAETGANAEFMRKALGKIASEATKTTATLDRVRIGAGAAVESTANGDLIDRKLKDITGNANEARRALEGMKIAQAAPSGGGGGGGGGLPMPGLLGAGIGAGVLLGPAAGPGALGLLASIPVLASTGAGALGTLALAFQGVSKAIMGNKKAFNDLGPSAQQFVLTIRSLDGWFDKLKQTAGAALFPGLTAGLKAALSPGTVGAITQAVTAFGHAIGEAGTQWGKYFGSSQFQAIFGPLMNAGAKNLGLMSDAALRLFDAVGVLARAAIPLTEWMVKGADAASRWVDSFVRSKDATGGLSGAMNEAKTSLQLVGNLFGALAKALYELGAALYPVSKVLVKDLTNGFNALAGIFQRNRKEIQDLVGGALSAFVSMVKGLWPIVVLVAKALKTAADNMGGWKVAFEVILGGLLIAKLATLLKAIKSIGVAIGLLPAEAKKAQLLIDGELITIGTTAEVTATKVGMIKKGLMGLAGTVVTAAIILDLIPKSSSGQKALDAAGGGFLGHLPVIGGLMTRSADLGNFIRKLEGRAPIGQQGSTGGGGGNPVMNMGKPMSIPNATGVYSQGDVYKLLTANGLPPDVAANLSRIAMAESTGHIGALNNNPKTGDYSVGLFQENFIGKMGQQRVAKYAPQFGMSSNTSVTAFTEWLKQHPSAQAKIAYDIYQSQGYGAWSTAKGLGITGGGGGSIYGPQPDWTTGLGPKPPKPPKPSVIPASATAFEGLAKIAASQATALANTGAAAKEYLLGELSDYQKAAALIEAKLSTAKGKAATTLNSALDGIAAKTVRIQKLIADAIVVIGDALLPDKLRTKLAGLMKQGTANADYAQVLTGSVADDYRKTIQGNLSAQAFVLDKEIAGLKAKLVGASGKQKTAIQTEIKKVQGQLDQVQQGILGSLQGNVSALQSKVGTIFGNVSQQFAAALGKLFFQNGLKTALEQQLADMQGADQLASLQDAIQSAKDQLAQDQTGGLAGVQWDAATGLTKNLYSPGAQKQIDADKKALDAAKRQLEEYNLGIRAAAERADMDKTYSEQVTTLNKKLADLADSFQNGTGSMQQLRDLASQYGIVITNQSIPDFKDLSSASNDLKQAFIDLTNYIGNITGATPKIPTGGGGGGGGTAPNTSPGGILQTLHAQAVAGIISPETYHYLISGHKMEIPGMATGGIVKAKPGGTIVRLAEAGQDEQVGPVGGRGGGGDVVVNFNGTVYGADADELARQLAPKIRSELLRTQKRNGGTTGIR